MSEKRQYNDLCEAICPNCKSVTNKAYSFHPRLQCWKCGEYFPEINELTSINYALLRIERDSLRTEVSKFRGVLQAIKQDHSIPTRIIYMIDQAFAGEESG